VKFLVDECLSPALVGIARKRGHGESTHVTWLGLRSRQQVPLRYLGTVTIRYRHVIIHGVVPMPNLSRRTFAALAASVGLFAVIGVAMPNPTADNKDIAQVLRAGGFVIVVRHGATFSDQADTDPLNFDNTAAQRNLNDKGEALAKAFGDAVRQVGIPIGKVYTSNTISISV
jgi:hypothetical protein